MYNDVQDVQWCAIQGFSGYTRVRRVYKGVQNNISRGRGVPVEFIDLAPITQEAETDDSQF